MDSIVNGHPSDHECSDDSSHALQGQNGDVTPHPGSSSLVPPHWLHHRHESYLSLADDQPSLINLEDNTDSSERRGSLWAKGVSINDSVIVSGTVPHVGTFAVWNCRIDTLDVCLLLDCFFKKFLYNCVLPY